MSLPEILSKFSPIEIGKHIVNYLSLFTHPIRTWKKVVSIRKTDSLNLTTLHLIYYGVLILLVFAFQEKSPILLIISYVTIEAIATTLPFLIYIIPYLIFIRNTKRPLSPNRLFRILLILKLQILPFILILSAIAKANDIEGPYILITNLAGLLLIMFIVLPPLVISNRWTIRLFWILANYVFTLVFLVIIAYSIIEVPDLEKVFNKLTKKIPSVEYTNNDLYYSNAIENIDNRYYLVVYEIDSSYKYNSHFVRNFYVTPEILKVLQNEDSIYSPNENSSTLTLLNETKNSLLQDFQSDYNFSKLHKDSAQFRSNREYYESIFKYIATYAEAFDKPKTAVNVIDFKTKAQIRIFTPKIYGRLYTVKTATLNKLKTDLFNHKKELESRNKKSSFTIDILLFPISWLNR
jgi:hypothetical protein